MSPPRLRIAVWHNLPPGGARRSIVAHVHGLKKLGHEVEVWSPPIPGSAGLMPFDADVPQHVLPLNANRAGEGGYAARLMQYWTEQKNLIRAMEEHSRAAADEMAKAGFQVLLATNCMYFHAPLIGRHFRGPKLLYLQDPKNKLYQAGERLIWRTPPLLPKGASLRARISLRFRDYVSIRDARPLAELDYQNAAAFDRMLVNSYFSRESMLRAYNLDSTVCYLGIDASLFQLSPQEKLPYVIGVGSITPNKNLEFIVRALGTIPSNRPKLVWVGQIARGDYRQSVSDLATKLGIELDIRVEASDEELVDLLGRATAFVYAPRLEPFGFAPLEANACGTVAIGVPEGGLRESIAEGVNGFLVEPDPKVFGEKVAWLLERPGLAKSMGLQAAEHVRSNWTWEQSVERLEHELFELVKA